MQTPQGFEPSIWAGICGEATALLQTLIRIDTQNPPGRELDAARALAASLAEDGLESDIIEAAPGRASLVCRLASGRSDPPLLLASHLDVVPPGDLDRWTHAPFSGDLADGCIWGRGAVDMKNMVAMSAMVLKLLARRSISLGRDVILAAVADEEAGCTLGSRFLVENYPDRVRAGFALGEVGGFPIQVKGSPIVVVQTAEKGVAWLRVSTRGPSGHGSMPMPESAVIRLCRALARVGAATLPQHNTEVAEAFIRGLASRLPMPDRLVLPRLLSPTLGPPILRNLIKDPGQVRNFTALLHNTAVPTVLRAGESTNVIPDHAEAELDGRTLPGFTARDLISELRQMLPDEDLEFEVLREAPAVINHPPDSALWDSICAVLGRHAPDHAVLPTMIPGFTDAKYFSRLGARWYGFAPVKLDPGRDPSFTALFHGLDERIPEDGFHWGLQVLWEVVHLFLRPA